ncbi:hypothetical protein IV203_016013 [Nitzschia inconspicua]|uniref:Uncharacterized protein n=1 Tax=Nitzschia inconspicua TaxID=303405 RepID=A0A9K3PH92_9STRA|nr:hypothetical protein IV203_016013 [Nitzschia inconspicua]
MASVLGLIFIVPFILLLLFSPSTAFVLYERPVIASTDRNIRLILWSSTNDPSGGENFQSNDNNNNTAAAAAAVVSQFDGGEDYSFWKSVTRTGMKDLNELQVGDVIVAKTDIPSLSVWAGSGYEITAMYWKGVNADTGIVETIPLDTLYNKAENDSIINGRTIIPIQRAPSPPGCTKYLEIYNPRHHQKRGPVVVSPEEIGLVTLKSELEESIFLAIPGLFWVFVAATFANTYTDRYGGDFWDAFFRT